MRILLVEDEARLADSIARGLREEGFLVEASGDGEDALHRLRTEPFDLVILDVMLPKPNGWAVLDTLRTERQLDYVIRQWGAPLAVLSDMARSASTASASSEARGVRQGSDCGSDVPVQGLYAGCEIPS